MPHRLLHLADLHLDRSFAGLGCQGELARRRRQGLRDALREAGRAAIEHGCEAVTVAGDLYEHERAGLDTERFLVETFESWRPLQVVIAPGNHDANLPGSIYRRARWPENVRIFMEPRLEPHQVDDGLTLWGLAHREPAWRGDPLEDAGAGGDGVHLALFHGSELGCLPEGKPAHAPFRLEDVRRKGFSAALCGHYHRARLDAAGGLLYPGSPEPLTFDETGPRGPVLVDVDADGQVAFAALDLNRWWMASATCDAADCGSTSSLIDRTEEACRAAAGTLDPEMTLVRVDLVGEVDPALAIDSFTLEGATRERTGLALVKVRDLTNPRMEPADSYSGHSTHAAFVRAAQEAMAASTDEDEAALYEEALRYGLTALAGAEIGLR